MKHKLKLSAMALALLAVSGFSMQDAQAQMGGPELKIKARGMLLNGIGPKMSVFVDGRLLNNYDVRNTEFREFTLVSSALQPGAKVDVFFSNDEYQGQGKDRNLIIESITVTGSQASGVYKSAQVGVYDKGNTYSEATDGKNTLTNKEGMADNGAMRFVLKNNGNGSGNPTPPGGIGSICQKYPSLCKPGSPVFPQPVPGGVIVPPNQIQLKPLKNADEAPIWSSGSFSVINNAWGVASNKRVPTNPMWSQEVGISAVQKDGSVACRFKFNFPRRADNSEVMAYPECFHGLTQQGASPNSGYFPRRLANINTLKSSYSSIAGSATGKGQMTYDLWFLDPSFDGKSAGGAFHKAKRVEIMVALKDVGRYGIAGVRNPNALKRGQANVNIGGKMYDVYLTRPGESGWTNHWNLVILQPKNLPDTKGETLDWKPIFEFVKSKGWITNEQYLAGIEWGYEAVFPADGQPPSGDLTISGLKVEAR